MKAPIFDSLPCGRANAVPLGYIQHKFNVSAREARRLIELERAHGAAILSSTEGRGGYFKAATAQEAVRFAISQRSRASAILKSARAAEQAARALRAEEMSEKGLTWGEGQKNRV